MPFASICPERGRRASAVVVAGLAAFAVYASGMRAPATAQSLFRSQAELVVLQVSVVDQRGRFVPDLRQDDFSVFEDGKRQEVAFFAATVAPLDLMLVIDTSSSMAHRLGLVQAAAINMIRTLRSTDRAAVVLFDEKVRVARPLTGDTASLEAAVRSAVPGGSTALYEASYIALRELARVRSDDGELRRQAIVVLSDGDDNKSRIEFDYLLEEARSRNATIFTILPLPDPQAVQLKPNTLFEMRRLAEATGGRAFTPAALSDLAGAYADIANELQQQYWLAFVPVPGSSGGFKRLSVRTEGHHGLRARSRSGYYGKEQRPGAPASVVRRGAADAAAAVPEVHSPRE